MIVKCKCCGKEFKTYKSKLKLGKGKYCSKNCYSLSLIKRNKIIINNNEATIIVNSPKYGKINSIVDLNKVNIIKKFTWVAHYAPTQKGFYLRTQINKGGKRKTINLHRLITNCPEGLDVDHVNHDTLDNRMCNLKICSKIENLMNKSSNTSGCCGVSWHKASKKWSAYINNKSKKVHLGLFKNKQDAINARKTAENFYFK